MFRQWKTILREASFPTSRRRERRFVPSLSGSASRLEDRLVLSGAGPAAHAVQHTGLHHGHNAKAPSQHGAAGAVTPVTVLGSRATSNRSLASFSTTTTHPLGTATVSPARRLGGTSTSLDFRNLRVALTSTGTGGTLSFSVTTTRPTTTTTSTGTSTGTTTTTSTGTTIGTTTISPTVQLVLSQLLPSQFPLSQLSPSQLSPSQLSLSQLSSSQLPLSQL